MSIISQIDKLDTSRNAFAENDSLLSQDGGSVNQSFDLFSSTQKAKQKITIGSLPQSKDVPGLTSNNFKQQRQTIKKMNGSHLVLNSTLVNKISSNAVHTPPKCASSPLLPRSEKKGQTYDDLWTDEEMFQDDSFILKATQLAGFLTPKAQKRRTSENASASKAKVPKCEADVNVVCTTWKGDGQTHRNPKLPVNQPFKSSIQNKVQTNGMLQGTLCPKASTNKENTTFIKNTQAMDLNCSNTRSVQANGRGASKQTRTVSTAHHMPNVSGGHSFPKRFPPSNIITQKNTNNISFGNIPVQPNPTALKGATQKDLSGIPDKSLENRSNLATSLPPVIRPQGSQRQVPLHKSYKFVSKTVHTEQPNKPYGTKQKKPKTDLNINKTPNRPLMPKPVIESPTQLNTSLTKDLLETLAQPDDILDSQMGGDYVGAKQVMDSDIDDDLLLLADVPISKFSIIHSIIKL